MENFDFSHWRNSPQNPNHIIVKVKFLSRKLLIIIINTTQTIPFDQVDFKSANTLFTLIKSTGKADVATLVDLNDTDPHMNSVSWSQKSTLLRQTYLFHLGFYVKVDLNSQSQRTDHPSHSRQKYLYQSSIHIFSIDKALTSKQVNSPETEWLAKDPWRDSREYSDLLVHRNQLNGPKDLSQLTSRISNANHPKCRKKSCPYSMWTYENSMLKGLRKVKHLVPWIKIGPLWKVL